MGNNLEMKLNIVIDWGVDLCEIITIVLHCNGTKISETQITITKLYLSSMSEDCSGIYIIETLDLIYINRKLIFLLTNIGRPFKIFN